MVSYCVEASVDDRDDELHVQDPSILFSPQLKCYEHFVCIFSGGGGIFPKRSTSHYPAKKLFKLQSSLTSQPKSTLPSQYECWRCPQKALMGFIFLHNFSSEMEVVNCLTLPCLVLSSDCLPAPSNDETPFTFGGNSLSNMGPIR